MEMTIRLFYSIPYPLIYNTRIYTSMKSNLKSTLSKRLEELETEFNAYQNFKGSQVIYDKVTSSFIVKTKNRYLPAFIINKIVEKYNLELTAIIINDQNCLNFSLTWNGQ